MKNNKIVVKKAAFLNALDSAYKDVTISYLLALRDGLTIIICHRSNNSIDFTQFKGVVSYEQN